MELLAQYPITEAAVLPHCGRPVVCVLANGDMVYGVLERVNGGNVYLKPLGAVPPAAVAQIKKNKTAANARNTAVAKTSAWGYPYGFGFGAWPWVLPLFLLAALFAFPFFW